MRAAVISEHGGSDLITVHDDWADPVAGEGRVVVRVRACALNYHDLFTLHGMPGITIPFPNAFTRPPACSVSTDLGSGGKYVRRTPRTVGH